MTNESKIKMAIELCKEFKESNTQAMVKAYKAGNRELGEWYEGKVCAYNQVLDILEN